MTPLAYLLAFINGIILGLLGGGGSILTVPAFAYVLGYEARLAIAMSLPVVGGAALVGAVRHWMLGHVDLRTALPFGIATMTAAYVGARLAVFVSGTVQLTLLGVVMLAAAVSMLKPPKLVEGPPPAQSLIKLVALALFVGLLTGIVGVGGGFLMVPALVVLGGVPMTHAVGTSLLVIAMNTTTGFLGYRGTVDVPWGVVLRFGATAAAGILVGSALIKHVPQAALKRAFAVLLVVIATMILWRSLTS